MVCSAAPVVFYGATPACYGAFPSAAASDNWLVGWSWLDCNGKLAGGTCTSDGLPAQNNYIKSDVEVIAVGALTADLTLISGKTYLLPGQLFVPSGVRAAHSHSHRPVGPAASRQWLLARAAYCSAG